jgi:hypothetical protein
MPVYSDGRKTGASRGPAARVLREHGKVSKRALANLSCVSPEVIDGLKVLLHGSLPVASARSCSAALWFGLAAEELQSLLLAMLV